MLQLHYYHERFVILTEVADDKDHEQREPTVNEHARLKRERRPGISEQNDTEQQRNRREVLWTIWLKLCEFGELMKRILWKLLEIHRWKICAVTVILSATYQPSACYLFPVIIWILGLPFRSLDNFIYIVTLLWSSGKHFNDINIRNYENLY